MAVVASHEIRREHGRARHSKIDRRVEARQQNIEVPSIRGRGCLGHDPHEDEPTQPGVLRQPRPASGEVPVKRRKPDEEAFIEASMLPPHLQSTGPNAHADHGVLLRHCVAQYLAIPAGSRNVAKWSSSARKGRRRRRATPATVPGAGRTGDGTAIATAGSNDSSSGDPRSVDTSALGGGDYGFKATVASNANYDGATTDCEKFTVATKQLTIGSKVHDAAHADVTGTSIPLGSVVHDTAQVSGGVTGFATPGVTFTFYENENCTATARRSPPPAATTPLSGDPRCVDTSALGGGDYGFKATVASNANYDGARPTARSSPSQRSSSRSAARSTTPPTPTSPAPRSRSARSSTTPPRSRAASRASPPRA